MPRFKARGSLERNATADLWKHTISRIPTLFGRLMYFSSLRDPNSGNYRHHGMMIMFGREESKRALQESHATTFTEWLNYSLQEKAADLRSYLAALEEPWETVLNHWKHTGIYRTQVPDSASPAENELFTQEIDVLIDLMKNDVTNEQTGAKRIPSSAQHA